MKARNTITTLAGGVALSAALVVGAAQAEMMNPEETAAELQQAIELNPELGQYTIDVNAEDGKVIVSGMIEEQDDFDELQGIIDGMADAENIENNIVRQ